MKYITRLFLLLSLVLWVFNGTPAPVFAVANQITPNTIHRVNVGRYDVPTTPNGSSQNPSITSDGQLFVFESSSTNLTNNSDNNGVSDILLYDRQIDKVKYISVSSEGQLSNGASKNPVISGDGQYVAFISNATNLGNGNSDMYIHHIPTAQTNRINFPDAVGSVKALDNIDLSHDGRYLVFASINSTLVPDDTNNKSDVFLYDTQTNNITRVSVDSSGLQADDVSSHPKISGDGRIVVFASKALNLVTNHNGKTINIYAYDVQTGQTTLVSHIPTQTLPILYTFWDVGYPTDITYNGRYVTFSIGPGLSAVGAFHTDRDTNTTTYISNMEVAPPLPYYRSAPSADVSEDGSVVLFVAIADNFYTGFAQKPGLIYRHNVVTGIIETVTGNQHDATRTVIMSDDLQYVIFGMDKNPRKEIYILNQQAQTKKQIMPLTEIRPQANNDSRESQISDDGQVVAFTSNATNLTPPISPNSYGSSGIFVYDARQDTLRYVSLTPNGQALEGLVRRFHLTADGKRVIYEGFSVSTYYVYNLETDAVSELILTPHNTMPLNSFILSDISYDARFMVISTSQSLLPEDTNQNGDTYWHDRETGEVQLISRTFNGTANNSANSFYSVNMTPDGRYVNFITPMNNIVQGVSGYHSYVYDSQLQQNTFVSKSPEGVPVSRIVDFSRISPNGRYVVFVFQDGYILNGDWISGPKILLHDRERDTTILLTDGFMREFIPGVDFTGLFISGVSNEYAFIATDRNNSDFNDNDNALDLYFFDLILGNVSRFMPDTFIEPGFATITPSNQHIAFNSSSNQLVPNDTNNKFDIFVAQVDLPRYRLSTANEQQLFNMAQPMFTDGMTFALFDVTPTGIITTTQFDDGGVVTGTIRMTVQNGLLLITVDGLSGGSTAQQSVFRDSMPAMMMNMLDEILPDDYLAIEAVTMSDVGLDIGLVMPNP